MTAANDAAAPQRPEAGFDTGPTLPGVTLVAVLRSELAKLGALRTTWWLAGGTLVIGIFIAAMFAVTIEYFNVPEEVQQLETAALASQSMTGIYFAMILLGALGVLAITTEFTTGSIRSALTAVPQRGTLIASKLLALIVWVGTVTAAMILAAHLVAAAISAQLNLGAIVTDAEVATTYLSSWAAVVLTALMGFGLGALLRSSAGGIVTLTVILFVVQIAVSLAWGLSDGAAWADALMRAEYMFLVSEFTAQSDAQAPFGPEGLQRWQAGLGLLLWAGVPVILGWVSFLRRDA